MRSVKAQVNSTNLLRCTLMAAGLTTLALSLSGCQKGLGGGARYEPQVTILADADAEDVAVAGGASTVEVAGYGSVKGRIVLEGSVTTPPAITPTKDDVCIAKSPIPNDRIVTGANGGLANVFIYLGKAPAGTKKPAAKESLTFDQQGCRFLPHCLFVQTEQQVLVLNSDNTLHNTHTNPQRQPAFNQGVQPNEKNGVPLTYARGEKQPISVTCDIHPWMLAYHLPLDHPYGVVSAVDGSFEIADLPAGTHEFTIWHEAAGVINGGYKVEIPVDGTAEVEIKVPAASMSSFNGERPKRIILSMIP
ncbi:MAG: hypothetical protein KDA93_20015 [Planctomycetaceae bacterium]|nr:hypothetical protein [Planctomycetaceae bacterium]